MDRFRDGADLKTMDTALHVLDAVLGAGSKQGPELGDQDETRLDRSGGSPGATGGGGGGGGDLDVLGTIVERVRSLRTELTALPRVAASNLLSGRVEVACERALTTLDALVVGGAQVRRERDDLVFAFQDKLREHMQTSTEVFFFFLGCC